MKMGKNDPRQSMSKSTKGSGYGNNSGKSAGPNEVSAPGQRDTTQGGPSKGGAPNPDPVIDGGQGLGKNSTTC